MTYIPGPPPTDWSALYRELHRIAQLAGGDIPQLANVLWLPTQGTDDDSAVINEILASVPSGGAVVIGVPGVTYTLPDKLDISEDYTQFYGNGAKFYFPEYTTALEGGIQVNGDYVDVCDTWVECEDTADQLRCGIEVYGKYYNICRNQVIGARYGIFTRSTALYGLITFNRYRINGEQKARSGIQMVGDYTVCSNNQIESYGDTGIGCVNGPTSVIISNNMVTAREGGATTFGIIIDDACDGCQITNNVIEGKWDGVEGSEVGCYRGIRIADNAKGSSPTNSIVAGNIIRNCYVYGIETYNAVSQWAPGQVIEEEYLGKARTRRYYGANVYKAVTAGTTGAIPPTHTSGTVSDGGVDWAYYRAGDDPKNLIIQNNIVINCRYGGIRTDDLSYFVTAGNIVHGCSSASGVPAIASNNRDEYGVIIGNVSHSNEVGNYSLGGTDDTIQIANMSDDAEAVYKWQSFSIDPSDLRELTNPSYPPPDYDETRQMYMFDPDTPEYLAGQAELPNDYAAGTDVYFTVHWNRTSTGGNGVYWGLEYIVYTQGEEASASWTEIKWRDIDYAHTYTPYEHIRATAPSIDGTGLLPGDVINFRFRRIADDVDEDKYTSDAAFMYLRVNYQSSTGGDDDIYPNVA